MQGGKFLSDIRRKFDVLTVSLTRIGVPLAKNAWRLEFSSSVFIFSLAFAGSLGFNLSQSGK
jgi:hypothetical protein